MSLQDHDFFGINTQSGVAGSYGHSIFIFLKILCTVFHSGCAILHSHRECTSFIMSPYTHQNLIVLFYCLFAFVMFIINTHEVICHYGFDLCSPDG